MGYQEILAADSLNEGREKINEQMQELMTAIDATAPVSITGTISLDATAFGQIHICTGTSSNYTVDLPTAVGNTGKTVIFKGANALTKIVTLSGVSGQTIDGESSREMAAQGSFTLMSDGTNWIIINEVGSWIAYTPVLAGWSVDPAISRSSYFRVGKYVKLHFTTSSNGTSNATTKTITGPFNADGALVVGVTLANVNNGTVATTPGLVISRNGSNIFDIYRDLAAAVWTASGNCRVSLMIDYKMV